MDSNSRSRSGEEKEEKAEKGTSAGNSPRVDHQLRDAPGKCLEELQQPLRIEPTLERESPEMIARNDPRPGEEPSGLLPQEPNRWTSSSKSAGTVSSPEGIVSSGIRMRRIPWLLAVSATVRRGRWKDVDVLVSVDVRDCDPGIEKPLDLQSDLLASSV